MFKEEEKMIVLSGIEMIVIVVGLGLLVDYWVGIIRGKSDSQIILPKIVRKVTDYYFENLLEKGKLKKNLKKKERSKK